VFEVRGRGALGERLVVFQQRQVGRVLLEVRLQPPRVQQLQPQLLRPRLLAPAARFVTLNRLILGVAGDSC